MSAVDRELERRKQVALRERMDQERSSALLHTPGDTMADVVARGTYAAHPIVAGAAPSAQTVDSHPLDRVFDAAEQRRAGHESVGEPRAALVAELERLREQYDVTKDGMAILLGLGKGQYSRILEGAGDPTYRAVRRAARLGGDPAKLLS